MPNPNTPSPSPDDAAALRFRILVGLNYRDRRVEPGEVVDDLPADSIPWLLEQGVIAREVETALDEAVTPGDALAVTPGPGREE